jgi:transposase InsO family protein
MCDSCAKTKPGPGVGKYPMKPFRTSQKFETIALDIFGPLSRTESGNEYVLVVCDYFTKWVELFAIPDQTSLTVADKLVTEVICRYGSPKQIHSDMGRQFESGLFTEVCRLLGVHKSRTTPYRPQSDGLVERWNRTLKQTLTILCSENEADWDNYLCYIALAYRSTEHSSTKFTPYMLMFGQEISCPVDLMYGSPPDFKRIECPIMYIEWLRSVFRESFDTAKENLL